MREALPETRAEMSPYAPRMVSIKVPVDKIGAVIGPGGKIIRGITEETGATVDIQDDGTVIIGSTSGEGSDRAVQIIKDLTREVEIGDIFTGKVVKIAPFGAFVEILPGRDGLGPHQRACRLPRPQRRRRGRTGRGDHGGGQGQGPVGQDIPVPPDAAPGRIEQRRRERRAGGACFASWRTTRGRPIRPGESRWQRLPVRPAERWRATKAGRAQAPQPQAAAQIARYRPEG